jgi:hypothetical protein
VEVIVTNSSASIKLLAKYVCVCMSFNVIILFEYFKALFRKQFF